MSLFPEDDPEWVVAVCAVLQAVMVGLSLALWAPWRRR